MGDKFDSEGGRASIEALSEARALESRMARSRRAVSAAGWNSSVEKQLTAQVILFVDDGGILETLSELGVNHEHIVFGAPE